MRLYYALDEQFDKKYNVKYTPQNSQDQTNKDTEKTINIVNAGFLNQIGFS
jgi:hypothetical protein